MPAHISFTIARDVSSSEEPFTTAHFLCSAVEVNLVVKVCTSSLEMHSGLLSANNLSRSASDLKKLVQVGRQLVQASGKLDLKEPFYRQMNTWAQQQPAAQVPQPQPNVPPVLSEQTAHENGNGSPLFTLDAEVWASTTSHPCALAMIRWYPLIPANARESPTAVHHHVHVRNAWQRPSISYSKHNSAIHVSGFGRMCCSVASAETSA